MTMNSTVTKNYNVTNMWRNISHHGQRFFVLKHSSDVGNDFFHVVVRHFRAPSCAYALRAVDEHHGNNWQVILWLNALAVVEVVPQQGVVMLAKQETRERTELRVYVSRAGRILACCDERREESLCVKLKYLNFLKSANLPPCSRVPN